MTSSPIESLLHSRSLLPSPHILAREDVAEGGCGVIGFACTEQVAGKHMLQALDQMRNRGNGKGGGIAAVGLVPNEFGVTQEILDNDYLLAIAYLDTSCRAEVEEKYVHPTFEVDHVREQPALADWKSLPRLEVAPPHVVYYFVRVRETVVEGFARVNGLSLVGDSKSRQPLQSRPAATESAEADFAGVGAVSTATAATAAATTTRRRIEDEIVYQNTYRLNHEFYAATGVTRAFVLSHAKNLLVLKMVGYADDVIRYYQLEDLHAHVWIGHHRYPTKGRVWHPGGAHPFIGMNEALVHNGDFANYASIAEYLRQRNIHQLYLTDTEVSVQVFDLLRRIYDYPLEYVIEAIAPTTERDFTLLPPEKQRIYQMLQTTHMHSSPDGPWFFIIAQSEEEPTSHSNSPLSTPVYRLTCITDTSMLRPQVFAYQRAGEEGPAIGFAASEKQAIDAALLSLSEEDDRFWRRADRYWNARGGSHTDGGAFVFSVRAGMGNQESGKLVCMDKFGREVKLDVSRAPFRGDGKHAGVGVSMETGDTALVPGNIPREAVAQVGVKIPAWGRTNGRVIPLKDQAADLFAHTVAQLPAWTYAEFGAFLDALVAGADTDEGRTLAFETLTRWMDRRYPTGSLRRSSLLALVDAAFAHVVESIRDQLTDCFVFVDVDHRPWVSENNLTTTTLTFVIDARGYEPEGRLSLETEILGLRRRGFNRFLVVNCRGHRFIGNGFGPDSDGVRIDVYGSPGDYLGSGMDGMEIHVHNNGQDQLAQIMKRGKLVVYGDVGQTFLYGAKGGEVYVLGNAAGRPLINAVGQPRVVINGTALDYLAESFMAGDPHNGGGFVILNGIRLTDDGEIEALETPYPGGNLFSLASGGAIFVRDPHRRVGADQLNGGEFYDFEIRDWRLIEPYLQENERLFGIPVSRLLEVEGEVRKPEQVYRKIGPVKVPALQAEEAWVGRH